MRAGPLTYLLSRRGKGSQQLTWPRDTRATFEDIRIALCTNVVLYAPLPNRPFCLYTDASNIGLKIVLMQETASGEQSIFFLSRKLTKAEQNFAKIEK